MLPIVRLCSFLLFCLLFSKEVAAVSSTSVNRLRVGGYRTSSSGRLDSVSGSSRPPSSSQLRVRSAPSSGTFLSGAHRARSLSPVSSTVLMPHPISAVPHSSSAFLSGAHRARSLSPLSSVVLSPHSVLATSVTRSAPRLLISGEHRAHSVSGPVSSSSVSEPELLSALGRTLSDVSHMTDPIHFPCPPDEAPVSSAGPHDSCHADVDINHNIINDFDFIKNARAKALADVPRATIHSRIDSLLSDPMITSSHTYKMLLNAVSGLVIEQEQKSRLGDVLKKTLGVKRITPEALGHMSVSRTAVWDEDKFLAEAVMALGFPGQKHPTTAERTLLSVDNTESYYRYFDDLIGKKSKLNFKGHHMDTLYELMQAGNPAVRPVLMAPVLQSMYSEPSLVGDLVPKEKSLKQYFPKKKDENEKIYEKRILGLQKSYRALWEAVSKDGAHHRSNIKGPYTLFLKVKKELDDSADLRRFYDEVREEIRKEIASPRSLEPEAFRKALMASGGLESFRPLLEMALASQDAVRDCHQFGNYLDLMDEFAIYRLRGFPESREGDVERSEFDQVLQTIDKGQVQTLNQMLADLKKNPHSQTRVDDLPPLVNGFQAYLIKKYANL